MSKDKNKQESTTAEDIARLVLDKSMNKIVKGVTVADLAILMDTVQVAKDVLTTSNYELGTLNVPDPDEVKKRLQEAGGGLYSDGRDNTILILPDNDRRTEAAYEDEQTRHQAYDDYKHTKAICGKCYESFDKWLKRREERCLNITEGIKNKIRKYSNTFTTKQLAEEFELDPSTIRRICRDTEESKKHAYGYDKYVSTLRFYRSTGAIVESTKSYEEWVLDREAKDRRIKSAYEAYNKYVYDMGYARSVGATGAPTKSFDKWVKDEYTSAHSHGPHGDRGLTGANNGSGAHP